jgi:hypothetical protein
MKTLAQLLTHHQYEILQPNRAGPGRQGDSVGASPVNGIESDWRVRDANGYPSAPADSRRRQLEEHSLPLTVAYIAAANRGAVKITLAVEDHSSDGPAWQELFR